MMMNYDVLKKTRVFLDKILRRFSMREQAEKKKFT